MNTDLLTRIESVVMTAPHVEVSLLLKAAAAEIIKLKKQLERERRRAGLLTAELAAEDDDLR